MIWPFRHKTEARYWLTVFALYALTEASIQLLFFLILNNFRATRITIPEFHLVMLTFQCLLIWPIWWVAYVVRKQSLLVQIIVNAGFYVVYTYGWFGPVQEAIGWVYNQLQAVTRPVHDRQIPYLDRGYEYSYLNYQLLKHSFRLSWFYLAAYFYSYRQEEKKRLELALANHELQLKMLTWHLNPSFYFKTISQLQQVAQEKPANATIPILQLAKVMEYIIYETKEKLISVKKEIQFLQNYIQLINNQESRSFFEIRVVGEQEHFKIAPLLLAGIIDKLAANSRAAKNYLLQLQFLNGQIVIKIEGANAENILTNDKEDSFYRRLQEFYPERFSASSAKGKITINITVDEEG